MPKVPLLGDDDQRRLTEALTEAADLVADGEAPDESLAKSASRLRVPAGHLPILVRAFNTARVETHRKSAADVLGASDDVQIADHRAVHRLMFPDTPGEEPIVKQSSAPWSDYDGPPRWLEDPRANMVKSAKLARDRSDEIEQPAAMTDKVAWRKALRAVDECRNRDQALRQEAAELYDTLTDSINKFAAYFRQPDALPFRDVADNSARILGPASRAITDRLERVLHPTLKRASRQSFEPVRLDRDPYRMVDLAIKNARLYSAAKDRLDRESPELARKAASALGPFLQDRFQDQAVVPGPDLVTKMANVATDIGVGAMMSKLWRQVPNPSPDDLRKGILDQITDPEHEMKIRDANAAATLAETMQRMPQLRSEDPALLADSYNDLSVLAPRSVVQPAILQHVLADRASQRGVPMAPDQIDKLLDIEDSLKERAPRLEADNKKE